MKKTFSNYFIKDFKFDLLSGVIIGLISLPLAIAFAVASGASAEQGIYTAIIAGVLMGALSGSKYQVSGPTGAFIVILLGIVNEFGIDGLMLAGFMAGIILLLMGILKFGSLIKYIPYPVLVGFTSGIGLIIFSGQIKDFFGLSFSHRPNGFIENVQEIVANFSSSFNLTSLIIGLSTIASLIIWKRYVKKIPPAPIALTVGIIVSLVIAKFFNGTLPDPLLVGNIPSGLPEFKMLDFSFENIRMLLPAAFTIAALGAIESLLSAVVADGMTGTKHNSNKELISQGIGNIVIPFFGGIPATGAIARTAANIKNGARTQVSAVVHGFVLLFILLVAAPYATYIPMAALSAILIHVAYNMAEIPHFAHLLKGPKNDAIVLCITFLLTVFVDLTIAVGVGIGLAAILFIKRVSDLSVSRIFEDNDMATEGSKLLHASVTDYKEIVLYEVAGPLFFGVASKLEHQIYHRPGQTLIMRMKHVNHIDASAIHTLEIIVHSVLKDKGKVYLATLHSGVKKAIESQGLIDKLGGHHYTPESTTIAIERAKAEIDHHKKLHKKKKHARS